MTYGKKLLVLSLLMMVFSQCRPAAEKENLYRPAIFALTVTDMDRSMDWYTQHLFFERDTIMHFPDYGLSVGMMHQGDFFLELVQFADGISRDSSLLPQGYFEIDGFFKMGFQAKDIANLYESLASKEEIKMVAPLSKLPPASDDYAWPGQYFLIEDPDANYVQFFSLKTGQPQPKEALSPFLIAVSSPDINASIDWYEIHLRATLISHIPEPDNERALLDLDGFVLELGEFSSYMHLDSMDLSTEVELSKIQGIRKLSFSVDDIQIPYENFKEAGVIFDFDLTEQKSMAFDRYFMIQDNYGNSIQLLQSDK
ncbi:MAG: hypothetical protein Roseis2KO_46910 [Roseivirga sp.]